MGIVFAASPRQNYDGIIKNKETWIQEEQQRITIKNFKYCNCYFFPGGGAVFSNYVQEDTQKINYFFPCMFIDPLTDVYVKGSFWFDDILLIFW